MGCGSLLSHRITYWLGSETVWDLYTFWTERQYWSSTRTSEGSWGQSAWQIAGGNAGGEGGVGFGGVGGAGGDGESGADGGFDGGVAGGFGGLSTNGGAGGDSGVG